MTKAGALIRVDFVLLPGSLILDWAGPAEALRIANQALARKGLAPQFDIRFVGPRPESVSSVGARIAGLEALPPLPQPDPHWVVLLGQVGKHIDTNSAEAADLLHWLAGLRLQAGQQEVLCVCAGSVIAARAGLLNHRQATTHHHHLDDLREAASQCQVQTNRVFVMDPPVYSSAGVTTGIDLFLHRIGDVCGPVIAADVAQAMVVALRRGPTDPELSPFLQGRNHLHAGVHRVQDAVSQRPADDWGVEQMAALANTSARHLGRLFAGHAGMSPLAYLRSIRLAAAEAALDAGLNVSQAADVAGFGSDTQLRRAWRQWGRPGTPRAAIQRR